MQVSCPYSGIDYQCIGYGVSICPHPIFTISLQGLLDKYLPAYMEGKLEQVDIHLLGCALLAKTDLVTWSAKLYPTPEIIKMWIRSLDLVAATAARVHNRKRGHLPKFRITTANSLDTVEHSINIPTFLNNVNAALDELEYSSADIRVRQEFQTIRDNIYRILRTPNWKTHDRYRLPEFMADWASIAGNFPGTIVTIPSTGAKLSTRQYWKQIIQSVFHCADNPSAILSEDISITDIRTLLAHCELHVEIGNIHADTLLQKLRDTIMVLEEFTDPVATFMRSESIKDIADKKASTVQYQELRPAVPVPVLPEPKRSGYPSQIAFIKAKLQWQRNVLQRRAAADGSVN